MSSNPPPLPGTSKPPRNWFQRNLKWVLPLAAVLMLGGWGLASWNGFRQMTAPLKASEPYQHALARASVDTRVQAALGQPVEWDGMEGRKAASIVHGPVAYRVTDTARWPEMVDWLIESQTRMRQALDAIGGTRTFEGT